ncbi:MAG: cytochrome c oxidase subunit 4 [Planctomycetota bacterium]|jgi:cytochrome c oxidase subunit 4
MGHQSIPSEAGGIDAAHAPSHPSHRGTYVTIFLILGALTFFEVFVPEVYGATWSGTTKMLLLTILAITKAALVALYFMHLKSEKAWLRFIGYTPVYMGFAVIIIMLESHYR